MAGKRLLLAAELPRGSATLARLLPLAMAMADRGHDVTLAVPAEAEAAAAEAGFPVLDAPHWTARPPAGFLAVNYGDLLLNSGWAAPDALGGLMDGWATLLAQTTPDLMVVDFAPTAMLAARVAGIPMAAVGDGYTLPPLTVPLPVLRPWADAPPEAPDSIDGRVLAVANARLAALKAHELRRLRDLFDGVPSFLCAFPELDHYRDRGETDYYGPIFPAYRGPAAVWPQGDGDRTYVELDSRHPALPGIAESLDRLGLPSLIQSAGMTSHQADALERGMVQMTTTANRTSLFAGCKFVICQTTEIATPALLAGKSLLMLPVFTEQMMTFHRVATQGLGQGMDPDSDQPTIEAAIRRIADAHSCHDRAVNFSRTYDGYRPGIVVESIADELDDLLG